MSNISDEEYINDIINRLSDLLTPIVKKLDKSKYIEIKPKSTIQLNCDIAELMSTNVRNYFNWLIFYFINKINNDQFGMNQIP